MTEQTTSIISKVWGMCNPLRDAGVSYGDYLEQLTYLLFLKMSDEYSRPPYKKETGVPPEYSWGKLAVLKGAELEVQRDLGKTRRRRRHLRQNLQRGNQQNRKPCNPRQSRLHD